MTFETLRCSFTHTHLGVSEHSWDCLRHILIVAIYIKYPVFHSEYLLLCGVRVSHCAMTLRLSDVHSRTYTWVWEHSWDCLCHILIVAIDIKYPVFHSEYLLLCCSSDCDLAALIWHSLITNWYVYFINFTQISNYVRSLWQTGVLVRHIINWVYIWHHRMHHLVPQGMFVLLIK